MSGYSTGRRPRTDAEWAREIQARIAALEASGSIRVGDWVLNNKDGHLIATAPGSKVVLSDPALSALGEGGTAIADLSQSNLIDLIQQLTGLDLSSPEAFFTSLLDLIVSGHGPQHIFEAIQHLLGDGIDGVLEILAKALGFPWHQGMTLGELAAWIAHHVFGFIDPNRLPIIPVSHIGDTTPNLLSNPSFVDEAIFDPDGKWFIDEGVSHDLLGNSASTYCVGEERALLSVDLIGVAPEQELDLIAYVRLKGVVCNKPDGIQLGVVTYPTYDGSGQGTVVNVDTLSTYGTSVIPLWHQLRGSYKVPHGVNTLRVRIAVSADTTAGQVWFDNLWAAKMGLLKMHLVDGLNTAINNIHSIFDTVWEKIKEFLHLDEIIAAFEEKTGLNIDEGPIAFLQSLIARIKERHGVDLNSPSALVTSIQHLIATLQQMIDHFEQQTGLVIDQGPIAFFQSLIAKMKAHNGIDLSSHATLFDGLKPMIENISATIQQMVDHFEAQTGLNINEGPIKFFQSLIAKMKDHNGIDLTSHTTLFNGLKPLIETIAATIQQMIDHFEAQTGLNIDQGPVAFFQSFIAKLKAHNTIDLTSHDTLFAGLKANITTLINSIAATIQQMIAHFETQTGLNIDAGPVEFFKSFIAKLKLHNTIDLTSHTTLLTGLAPGMSAAAMPTGWQAFLDKVGGQANATNQTIADRLQHLTSIGKFDVAHLLGQLPASQIGGITIGGTTYTTLADAVTTNTTGLQATWDKWLAALTGVQNTTGDPQLTADQIAELMATVVANATAIAQIQAETQGVGGGGISGGDDFERPANGAGIDPGWARWQRDATGSKYVLDGNQAVWPEVGKASEVRYWRTPVAGKFDDSHTKTAYQAINRVTGKQILQSAVVNILNGDRRGGTDTIYGRVSDDGKQYIVAQYDWKTVRLRYSANRITNPTLQAAPAAIPFQSQTNWTLDAATSYTPTGGSVLVAANNTTRDLVGVDLVPVTLGQAVEVSAWVRTNALTGGSGTIGVLVNGTYTALANIPTGTVGWTQLTATYMVPAGVTSLRFQIRVANASGQVWFDNLYLNPGEVDLGPSATCAAPSVGTRYTLECGDPEGSTDALHTYRVLRNGTVVLIYTDAAKATAYLDDQRGWGFGGKSDYVNVLTGELSPSSVNAMTVADNPPTTTVGTYLRVYRKDTTGLAHPDGDAPLPDNCLNQVQRTSVDLLWDIKTQTLDITKPGPYNINARLEFAKDIVGVDRWDLLLYRKGKNDAGFTLIARGGEMPGSTGSDAHAVAGGFSYYFEEDDQVRLGIGNKGTGLAAAIQIVGDAGGVSSWMTVTRGA